MSLERTKSLFQAMMEHSALLDKLITVITDPIHYQVKGSDKNIKLLENAGLVHEVEDEYFMPGENIDALHQLLNSSIFADEAPPELDSWKASFKNISMNYKSLSEQELSDSTINSLPELQKAGTLSFSFTNKLQRQLRNIESDISNNLNRFPRLEDKVRQSNYYLSQLHGLQSEYMTRLTYYDLKKLSTTPDTDKIVLEMDKRLYELRNLLKRVYNRVSEFNFHVRKQTKRKNNLSAIFTELLSGQLELNAEDLGKQLLIDLSLLTENDKLYTAFHLAATNLTGEEELVLDELISRANIEPMLSDSIQARELSIEEYQEHRPEITTEDMNSVFEKKITEVTRNLFKSILTQEKPVSVMDFWVENSIEEVSQNAWLYIAGDSVFELSEEPDFKGKLSIKGVEEKQNTFTQITILRDLVIEASL